MKATPQVHIKLPPDVHAALKNRARAEERSINMVVVRALRAYLATKTDKEEHHA